jgi:hypothetical protein
VVVVVVVVVARGVEAKASMRIGATSSRAESAWSGSRPVAPQIAAMLLHLVAPTIQSLKRGATLCHLLLWMLLTDTADSQ